MAMLVGDDSEISGPQTEVLDVILAQLLIVLREESGMKVDVASRIAHKQLSRVQAALDHRGYIRENRA